MHLLRADGTIPIYYQGVKYNIPLKMYLPEGFPRVAPVCYVSPTAEMIVKPGHAIVDASGLVRGAFLDEWRFDRGSQLADLAARLSDAFGRNPPLFAKPTTGSGAAANPNPNPNPGGGARTEGLKEPEDGRTRTRRGDRIGRRRRRRPPVPRAAGRRRAPARSYPEVPGVAAANARRPRRRAAPGRRALERRRRRRIVRKRRRVFPGVGRGRYQQYNRVRFPPRRFLPAGAGRARRRRARRAIRFLPAAAEWAAARGGWRRRRQSRAVAADARSRRTRGGRHGALQAERLLGVQAELADAAPRWTPGSGTRGGRGASGRGRCRR